MDTLVILLVILAILATPFVLMVTEVGIKGSRNRRRALEQGERFYQVNGVTFPTNDDHR